MAGHGAGAGQLFPTCPVPPHTNHVPSHPSGHMGQHQLQHHHQLQLQHPLQLQQQRSEPSSSSRTSVDYAYDKGKASTFSSTLDVSQPSRSETAASCCGGCGGGGLDGDAEAGEKHPNAQPRQEAASRPWFSLRQRLHHFTWAWFTLPMSTGGLSLLIYNQPHQFPGLRSFGLFVYIVNLVVFSCISSAILTRFFLFPGDFKASMTHPREGFFVPTAFLSVATIITSTQRYVIPDDETTLLWAVQMVFWTYVCVTLALAVGQYSFVFAAHSFGLHTMMPTWILPIFPVMLSGTIASVIAGHQPDKAAVPIVVAGMTCQGLGTCVSFFMYAHMVGRLMQAGLPNREHRPGLFMCVGPPSFTALAFIGMAQGLPKNFDVDMDGMVDAAMVRNMAVIGAVFLWALSLWWFGIAAIAVLQSPPRDFHLGWWAMVFPNTGFTLATISLGKMFQSESVLWFATAMSICLAAMYCFVLYHNVRAVLAQDIMYPGRDEDVEDH